MRLRDWSLRRWLLVIALIILLPLIGLRLHLKWRVHRAVAELREQGKPVNWADLNRLHNQPVPDEENAFVGLTNAYAKLSQPNVAERDLIPVVGTFIANLAAPLDLPENVQLATASYLERQREGLEEALAALRRPLYRNPRAYGQKGYDPNRHSQFKSLISLLHLQARYSMVTGNGREACRLIEAQLRFAEYQKDEPEIVTHLFRLAYINMAMINTELLLGIVDEPWPQLEQLKDVVKRAKSLQQYHPIIEGQRVTHLEAIHWRSERLLLKYEFDFENLLNSQTKGFAEVLMEDAQVMLYRMAGFGERDLLHLLNKSGTLEQAAGSVEALAAIASNGSPIPLRGLVPHYWVELVSQGQTKQLQKWVSTHARLRAADAALAVAQYRVQHEGRLPDSLDSLVPEFLEAMPVEPQSGKPFELIVTSDGYGIGRGTPVFSVKLKTHD